MPTSRREYLRGLLGFALPLAACRREASPLVNVGAKTGPGQAFLAEAIALRIEKVFGPGSAELRPAIGGTAVTHETLLANQIDLYPEYSGAALTVLLGLTPQAGAEAVREQVKTNYRTRFRCEWAAPLGFENGPVLVTAESLAREEGVENLSSAAARTKPWRLGATREFMGAPDGFPLLMSAYKLPLSGAVQVMERAQLYEALGIGQITLVAGEALDVGARSAGVKPLTDDRGAFPPYEAGIVVALEALDRLPGLLPALSPLAGKFPFAKMAAVVDDIERAEAAKREDPNAPPLELRAMAAAFLREAGSNPAQ